MLRKYIPELHKIHLCQSQKNNINECASFLYLGAKITIFRLPKSFNQKELSTKLMKVISTAIILLELQLPTL